MLHYRWWKQVLARVEVLTARLRRTMICEGILIDPVNRAVKLRLRLDWRIFVVQMVSLRMDGRSARRAVLPVIFIAVSL